jgi:hypothetical protein
MIELIHQIGEADGVDVEDRRGVWIRAHLWRVAGDEQDVAQAHCRRAEEIAQHPEQIAVAATIMGHSLDPNLLLDKKTGE